MTCVVSKHGRNEANATGVSRLNAQGAYAEDAFGTVRLVMDLQLSLQASPMPPFQRNASFCIPDIKFELRPDMPWSVIGRDVWEDWRRQLEERTIPQPKGSCRTLPPYDEMGVTNGPYGVVKWPMGKFPVLLSWMTVLLTNACFSWGDRGPVFSFALNLDLPPDGCWLGRDFLRTGLVCRKDRCTFYFPVDKEWPVWGPELPKIFR